MYGNDCANATLPWRMMRNSEEESPTSRPTPVARRNHLATLKKRMDSSVRRVGMGRHVFRKVAKVETPKPIVHLEDKNDKSSALDGSLSTRCFPCKISMAWIICKVARPILIPSFPLLSSSTFLIEDPGSLLCSTSVKTKDTGFPMTTVGSDKRRLFSYQ